MRILPLPSYELIKESIFFNTKTRTISMMVAYHLNQTLDALYMHLIEAIGAQNLSANLPYMSLTPFATTAPADTTLPAKALHLNNLGGVAANVSAFSCVNFTIALDESIHGFLILASNYTRDDALSKELDIANSLLVDVSSLPTTTAAMCPYETTRSTSTTSEDKPKSNTAHRTVVIVCVVAAVVALALITTAVTIYLRQRKQKDLETPAYNVMDDLLVHHQQL